MRLFRIFALLLLLACATLPAHAQALPDWQATTVNDLALVLTPQDAQAVDRALAQLQRDSGVQGTLVTLPDRARHGGEALEPFATRLFNHWGVGDASRNDGFMLLFLRDDREARIELGRGYPVESDIIAQDIMSRVMLPAFRRGEYSAGLREGTLAVIDHIARPHAAGQPPLPAPGRQGGWKGLAGFLAAVAAILAVRRHAQGRRNRCPHCGAALVASDTPLREDRPDGGWRTTHATRRRDCPACGWSQERRIALPVITHYDREGRQERVERPASGRSDSGFGGGSSDGGGASGRW